jgi:excisionase family DNA binding protein
VTAQTSTDRALPVREREVERLLGTPLEAARALGISRSKLYELLAAGVIPSVLIGSCRRIPLEDLRDAVARLRSAANWARRPQAASATWRPEQVDVGYPSHRFSGHRAASTKSHVVTAPTWGGVARR